MTEQNVNPMKGAQIGRYRIERELGRGGMGIVFLAKDQKLGKDVALKTVSIAGFGSSAQNRDQRRARFIREAKALAQLSHSNVVHVFDVGEQDSPQVGWVLYYSMEYVEGATLSRLVQKNGPLLAESAAGICFQVAAGLGAAHQQGIVHRDVKPGNIFITPDKRAVIGDFGICKIEGGTQITRRNQMVGTPNYLAPEQILGDEIGPYTDVFALGALFYIIVAHRALRSGVDATSLLRDAQSDIAKERALHLENVPHDLRKIIARALERNPKKRFADGQAFAEALSTYAGRLPDFGESQTLADRATLDSALDSDTFSAFQPVLAENTLQLSDPSFLDSEDGIEPKIGAPSGLNERMIGRSEITAIFNARQIHAQISTFLDKRSEAKKKERQLRELSVSAAGRSRPSEKKEAGAQKGRPKKTKVKQAQGVAARNVSTRDDVRKPKSEPAAIKKQQRATLEPAETPPSEHKDEIVQKIIQTTDFPKKEPDVPAVQWRSRLKLAQGKVAEKIVALERGLPPAVLYGVTAIFAIALAVVVVFWLPSGELPDEESIQVEREIAKLNEKQEQKDMPIPDLCKKAAQSDAKKNVSLKQYAKAEKAFRNHKPEDAQMFGLRAVGADPQNADAHFLLAQLYESAGTMEVARLHYRCVMWLEPNSPNAQIAKKKHATLHQAP